MVSIPCDSSSAYPHLSGWPHGFAVSRGLGKPSSAEQQTKRKTKTNAPPHEDHQHDITAQTHHCPNPPLHPPSNQLQVVIFVKSVQRAIALDKLLVTWP